MIIYTVYLSGIIKFLQLNYEDKYFKNKCKKILDYWIINKTIIALYFILILITRNFYYGALLILTYYLILIINRLNKNPRKKMFILSESLKKAIESYNWKAAQKIIDRDFSVNAYYGSAVDSVLMYAIEKNTPSSRQFILSLINKGENINYVDNNNITPLIKAVALRHWEIVKMLVKHGADINHTIAQDSVMDFSNGSTALIYCIACKEWDIVNWLLDYRSIGSYTINNFMFRR